MSVLNSIINQFATAISNEVISNIENEKDSKSHSVEILKHSQNYSKLLDAYVHSAIKNMRMKKCFKIIFFIVTMCSLIAVVVFFFITLRYAFRHFDEFEDLNGVTIEAILSMLAVIIPAISSLIVAFIKIPEIIAQYLFNTKEDDNMNLIIKNIQDYDKAMFAMEQQVDELLKNNKDQSADVKDDIIEDPPTAIAK